MGSPGEKYIKLQVVKFPKYRDLKPHYKAKIGPLDRLFWLGLGHYIRSDMAIDIDPKKVHISSMDAVVLYTMHKDFYQIMHGPTEGQEMAADHWVKYGPQVTKEVPKGLMFLEEGYLSIRQVVDN